MGVDTIGYATKKSVGQVIKALQGLGYKVDTEVFKNMNTQEGVDFYLIPFKNKDEQRMLSFGIYYSATNGLAETLPKTGRRLKNSKQFTHLSISSDRSAFKIMPELIGALGGGYVHFVDTGSTPAVEVDDRGKLVDHNPLVGRKLILKTLRDYLYFNIDEFTLLSNEEAKKPFIHNTICNYKPVYVYQERVHGILVLFVDKYGKPYISTISGLADGKLFKEYVDFSKKNKTYLTIKDIAY